MDDSASTFETGLVALLPRLRRFAHGLCRSGADADDLAQQTVERALRARTQWEPGTRLDSWLYRIMRNLWVDNGRAHTRASRVIAPEEAGLSVGEDPTPGMDAKLELAHVMRAMDTLPVEQREAIALVLIEGLGYREAAALLEIPEGTLASRLVRGRTALLALLGEG